MWNIYIYMYAPKDPFPLEYDHFSPFMRVPSDQNPTPTNPIDWIGDFWTRKNNNTQTSSLFPLPTCKIVHLFVNMFQSQLDKNRWKETSKVGFATLGCLGKKFQTHHVLQRVMYHATIRKGNESKVNKHSNIWFTHLFSPYKHLKCLKDRGTPSKRKMATKPVLQQAVVCFNEISTGSNARFQKTKRP